MPEIQCEDFGKVFPRRGGCIGRHMSLRVIVRSNVSVVVAAESSLKRDAAKQRPVSMGQSVSVFVTQGIS